MGKELARNEEILNYHNNLIAQLHKVYDYAEKARKKGLDPKDEVEIKIAHDVAARVEEIVGPKGIAEHIRKLEGEGIDRTAIAFRVVRDIVQGKFGKRKPITLAKQAIKTGTAILTEGVLVAPTEGIPDVKIKTNPDGSEYLAIYYAGPIRSAGGTVAAMTTLLGDVVRQELGLANYRPTDTTVERYVEEINLYESRVSHLQYKPPDDHIRIIVKNCPICIDGDPTEKIEVSAYKDVPGIETNRVRGGVPLVVCEGIALKSAKISKYSKKFNLKWDWIEQIIKVKKKANKVELKPDYTYLTGIVAGRPIFSYPSAKGGFRLRYGRSLANSLMAKTIHPATMIVVDRFLAIGTHMKIERPGKGCVVSAVEELDGPVVRLKGGDVVKLNTEEDAIKNYEQIEKVLYLGDMLTAVGDFIKSNHPLMPPAWCQEYWEAIVENKINNIKINNSKHEKDNTINNAKIVKTMEEANKFVKTPEGAFEFAKLTATPLHPDYTYHWSDISSSQLKTLFNALKTNLSKIKNKTTQDSSTVDLSIKDLTIIPKDKLDNFDEIKGILEELLIPHKIDRLVGDIILNERDAYTLYATLGFIHNNTRNINNENRIIKINLENEFPSITRDIEEKEANYVLRLLKTLAGIEIKAKAPTYIGARMGRPEKAKERMMDGKPNVLFPTGIQDRDLTKLYTNLQERNGGDATANLELARFRCTKCGQVSPYKICPFCGGIAVEERVCKKCGAITKEKEHCGMPTVKYNKRSVPFVKLYEQARARVGYSENLKGVKGLTNKSRIPERLEKGFIRARHKIYIFKDGTSRFDATDIPLTHFIPAEIGLTMEKLKELGYTKNYKGEEIQSLYDIVPLKPQDIVIPEHAGDYFMRVANALDEMLITIYEMPPFYNIKKRTDIIGHLFMGLSPHTSAGVLSRVIGFTKAYVIYGHPYFHTAKRRNCDGDEDTIILLLDGLLNFSREYLSEKRGGTMDAPIVVTPVIDPAEVDDEAHCIELVDKYPAEFYELAEHFGYASDAGIKTIGDVLGTPAQYGQLPITIVGGTLNNANLRTSYVILDSIPDKVNAQLKLHKKLRSVELNDSVERLITNHFIPDIYGNLRSFSRQEFRCVRCNTIYRRVPLIGKCPKCGGNLILTIHKGGIIKYLDMTTELIKEYHLSKYLKDRIDLVNKEIHSIFVDETKKQLGLTDFV